MIIQLSPSRTLTLTGAPPTGTPTDEQLDVVLADIDDSLLEAHKDATRAVLASLERVEAVCDVTDEGETVVEFSAFVAIMGSCMFKSMLDMVGPEGQVLS